MFTDWNTQHRKDINSSEVTLSNITPVKIPARIFADLDNIIIEFLWKISRIRIVEKMFGKEKQRDKSFYLSYTISYHYDDKENVHSGRTARTVEQNKNPPTQITDFFLFFLRLHYNHNISPFPSLHLNSPKYPSLFSFQFIPSFYIKLLLLFLNVIHSVCIMLVMCMFSWLTIYYIYICWLTN